MVTIVRNSSNLPMKGVTNGTTDGCIYDPELSKSLKNAYDMGHQVASHTWYHKNLTTLNWDQRNRPSYGFSLINVLTSISHSS